MTLLSLPSSSRGMEDALQEALAWKRREQNDQSVEVQGGKDGSVEIRAVVGDHQRRQALRVIVPSHYPQGTLVVVTDGEHALPPPVLARLNELGAREETTITILLDSMMHAFDVMRQFAEQTEEEEEEEEEETGKEEKNGGIPSQENPEDIPRVEPSAFSTGTSPAATRRLMKELKAILSANCKDQGFEASLVGDDLYVWNVKLFGFDPHDPLGADLEKTKEKHILLQMQFPHDFPMSPPFVRVLRPRFRFHSGHVTVGGSICMELLTRRGWSPVNTVEACVVQIRAAFLDGRGRLDFSDTRDYGEWEARDAFNRVVARYGWT